MTAWKILRKSQEKHSNESILEGLRGNEKEKQFYENYLFDRFLPFIYKAKKQYKISEDEALSAYSDAIISLIGQIRQEKFRGESKLSTYLYKIHQHKCIDLIRSQSRQNLTVSWLEDIPNMGSQVKDILQQLITQEKVERLTQVLESLGKNCKDLLLMWGEGYSLAEIAQAMNLKDSGSAKSRKYTCLKRLKAIYKKESIHI